MSFMSRLHLLALGCVMVFGGAVETSRGELILTRSEVLMHSVGPNGANGGIEGEIHNEFTVHFAVNQFGTWKIGGITPDDIGSEFELNATNGSDYLAGDFAAIADRLSNGLGVESDEVGDIVEYGLGVGFGGAINGVFERFFFFENSFFTDPMNPSVATEVFVPQGTAPDLLGYSITRLLLHLDDFQYFHIDGSTWWKGAYTLSIFGEAVPEPSTLGAFLITAGSLFLCRLPRRK